MIFNSIDFAIFLPAVFILYWFVVNRSITTQNFLIIVASYIFYGWWDFRFLGLILFSTVLDFAIGLGLKSERRKSRRKVLLWCSILVNLGLLFFFKYYNFFLDSFKDAFSFFGQQLSANSLQIILPVGISFYTFQTLSYTIDVYKKKLEPTADFIAFASFVSFFPQLVAGPIERASHLLTQFYKKRTFNYALAVNGLRQILWGLFKKIVIADNCAEYVNEIFNNSDNHNGLTLFLGAVFFTFQIYGDFSGYSDIAIGTSRLFGFDLMDNFRYPYFSRDVAEFWRRWHISLSTWFRDYLYIPLGGSRGSALFKVRNAFIIFIVSGFWHGAKWTFIFWGVINACFFLPLLLSNKNRNNVGDVAQSRALPSLREFTSILSTFIFTVFAWVIFRANSMHHAYQYITGIFYNLSSYINPHIYWQYKKVLVLIASFLLIEWMGRKRRFAIEYMGVHWKTSYRLAFYYILIFIIFWFGGTKHDFIYFQF